MLSETNWSFAEIGGAKSRRENNLNMAGKSRMGACPEEEQIGNPVLGQFISPDPFVLDEGLSINYNRYAYCLNNPLKYTDPTGEFWMAPDDTTTTPTETIIPDDKIDNTKSKLFMNEFYFITPAFIFLLLVMFIAFNWYRYYLKFKGFSFSDLINKGIYRPRIIQSGDKDFKRMK